ncbi:MAG: hypothetical protein HeimC3_53710 [Candidatus Heimdallarchaeota archaeon LC_3]|nr:MAG: hypothetical protein HeimC3_53710 [Candidatus Heimdallarchaeota archaeon LC_3]
MKNTKIAPNEDQLEWLDDTLIHQSETSFIKNFRQDIGEIKRIESRKLEEYFSNLEDSDFEESVYAVEENHIVSLYLIRHISQSEEFLLQLDNLPLLRNLHLKNFIIPIDFPIVRILRHLEIHESVISHFHDFSNLSLLERLVLHDCNMSILPESITELEFLRDLEILSDREVIDNSSEECLTKPPKNLGNLVNLEILSIESTELNELPGNLSNLRKLKILYLSDNNLNNLPKSIGELEKLEKIGLSGNKLSNFPKSFFNLTALKSLSMARNNFSELPPEISQLLRLEEINLLDNPWTSFPKEIAEIPFLKKIIANSSSKGLFPSEIFEKVKKNLLKIEYK